MQQTLIESYIRHILAQLTNAGEFITLWMPLTEANMTADVFNPNQLYVICNVNTITVTTGCQIDIDNYFERYSLQLLFVKQHPANEDWEEFCEIMAETEQMRRNFLAQLTYEQTFAESNKNNVEFGTSQPWVKQFNANLSGWSLDLNFQLDIGLKYCYNCCSIPPKWNPNCSTPC